LVTVHPSNGMLLRLLDGFALECDGSPLPLTLSGQYVIAYAALRGKSLRRNVAKALWSDVSCEQATASLRTAIWRLQRTCGSALRVEPLTIELSQDVVVDVRGIAPSDETTVLRMPTQSQLRGALLPGWYDDWVGFERERFHQLRLNALQELADRFLKERRYAASLEIATACVNAEPLSEAAHRAVARVHLAEGNFSEAVDHIEAFRRLVHDEVDSEPSGQMMAILADARRPRPLVV
jgi:DNA-binding SARP family transcriptional activator